MGIAAEIITGKTVNAAALTAVTNATGDSNVVRSFNPSSSAFLLNGWAQNATAGELRVRSPRMHDNVNNIRSNVLAATPQPLLPWGVKQALYGQDTLTIELAGGGAETDAESLLIYYQDVPGLDARLKSWQEIIGRFENLMTLEFAITSGVTLGDYVGAATFASATGQMEANVDYAILGYETSVAVCSVGIRGQDTGNVRIGGPGTTQRLETRSYFKHVGETIGLPFIPVINSANAGGTLLDVVQNAANLNPTVSVFLAQLTT